FFFQAEDGIRDGHVTGVQTCALPISLRPGAVAGVLLEKPQPAGWKVDGREEIRAGPGGRARSAGVRPEKLRARGPQSRGQPGPRSEERRVGKEWRCRWTA